MALEALRSPPPPKLPNDDVETNNMDTWTKKKRSSAKRPPPPSEDEYLALCLIMLARGQTSATSSSSSADTSLHECTVCRKSFHSYQALGGHKASHRKASSAAMAATSVIAAVAAAEHRPCANGRSHECSVCQRSFPTGQALGGHKRRHYEPKSTAAVDSGGRLRFDLNMPALPELGLGLGVGCGGLKSQRQEADGRMPVLTKKPRLSSDFEARFGLC